VTAQRACTSDLAIRERRGLLSPAERSALEAHLGYCVACRVVIDLGKAFEAPDAPELDDGARIQRLARAAETWTKSGRAPRGWRSAQTLRRKVFVAVAACLVLCCGIAGATLGVRPWAARIAALVSRGPTPVDPATSPSRPLSRPHAAPAAAEPEVAAPEEATMVLEATEARQEAPAASTTTTPGGHPAKTRHRLVQGEVPEDAAAMLRAANDARRGGDAAEAMALYAKLQRRFPSSPEAELSSVPFGEMLLADHQPGSALEQFGRPAGALGGNLRPEVLYGRARALAALGDQAGERRAWRELLDEFPKCPYVETARRRLESTPSSAPPSP
jgi:TolA-binding protein